MRRVDLLRSVPGADCTDGIGQTEGLETVANQPEAFLSYTRLDDEFFGGAITSLRRSLELGVKVVTGDRAFNIFQDVDGIEFGQKWQERLNEAITASTLLLPIVTPLFFKSDPCRNELEQFIDHEKTRGRSDLILPIYFVTTPLLERPELLTRDPLASEIASRQRHDWRSQADLPANDPQIRRAVRELADKIAVAIERIPGSASSASPPDDDEARRTSELIESPLLEGPAPERQPRKSPKRVLWVDDLPDNNALERHALAAYNMEFQLAASTGEALAALRNNRFDAIVSDMGRPSDARAGYTLLEAVRGSGDRTPYFIYAGSKDPTHVREALNRGAQGTTNVGDELLQMLLQALDV